MNEEILKIIKEKGLLLEKEVYDLFNNIHDAKLAKGLLEGLERFSGQKMITKSVLNKNFSFVRNFVSNLPGEDRISMENIIVKLGLSLEIIKERSVMNKVESDLKKENKDQDYKIFYSTIKHDKKLTVEDFVGNFRMRYHQLQRILMQRPDLQNLVSINKIGSERRNY